MAITLDTHGGADSQSTVVTNQTVTLTVTAGDLIIAAVSVAGNQTSNLTVSDNVNSGNYTQALSPYYSSTLNQTNGVWYFANSAGGSITVKAALTSGSSLSFALTAACFKGASTSTSGVLGPANTATGSTANASGTSVTPAQNGALIFSSSQMDTSVVSGAGSGFTLLDNESAYTLFADEYEVLATAGSISATWSNSSQTWVVQTAVFYPPSGTVTMDWTTSEELHAKAGFGGFSYDDDTQFNSIVPPIPKQFEQDCDTTSRNFDFNCAAEQWVEGEQPPPLPRIFGNPFEWDGADVSRNVDFFLAQMQLLDQEQTTLKIPPPPTMDLTEDYEWEQDSTDVRVVEDQDEMAAQAFSPVMDWTADFEWQQSRDVRVVENEDYRNPSPFSPILAWDDWDWSRNLDARVVEDEDERELARPIPAGAPLLNLGWDQDAIESRWFQGSADPGVGSAALVDEPAARPFSPTADWTADYDWQHSTDARVVEDESDTLAALPYSPLQFPDSDEADQRSFDTRVVEDEDERVIQKPTPVFTVPTMDWTQEAEYQRWLDTWVVEDEDAPAARSFAPALAIDDADWVQVSSLQFPVSSFQSEEDRNNLWPLVVPPPVLLGYDQDGEAQRWFGTWVVEDESDVREARPFHPIVGYDDWDWSKNFDVWVVVQEDVAERSMMTIFPQIIAMAVQQMLCSPLLGLQMMAALPLMLCQRAQAAPGEELGLEEVRIDV
jgi:hypothetical protein